MVKGKGEKVFTTVLYYVKDETHYKTGPTSLIGRIRVDCDRYKILEHLVVGKDVSSTFIFPKF